MKYQKSMMKLMERIILSKKGKNIEFLIGEAKTGRNSSFEALNFLEKIGLIKIENLGNQKIVSLVKDNYSLQFKYYLDSAFEAIVGKDKNLLYNSLINLAYVYCFSKEFFPKTKVDALEFLNQKYKIKNLVELKKTGIEIGKEIFR